MTKQVRSKDLRQGKTIYVVNEFAPIITKYRVESKPYVYKATGKTFVKVSYTYNGKRRINEMSLRDKNIISNDYNTTRAYKTLKSAERYLWYLKHYNMVNLDHVNNQVSPINWKICTDWGIQILNDKLAVINMDCV